MTELLIIAVGTAAVLLASNLYRHSGAGRGVRSESRRRMSRLLGSAELLIGTRRRRVSLEVTDSTLYYEGSRRKGSIELESILEIEYDTVSAAGHDIRDGRVLRLRSTSGTVEFVLPREAVTNWYLVLPPHPDRARQRVAPAPTPKMTPRATPLVWHR